MKKIKHILLVLLYFILVLFSIISNKFIDVKAQATKESVENAYGYKISLVKYNGSGDPVRVGKPILVVHPNMLESITIPTGSGYPSSGEQFAKTPWPGIHQIKDGNDPSAGSAHLDSSDPGAAGEYWGENDGEYPQGAGDNPNNDLSGCGDGCDDVYWKLRGIIGSVPSVSKTDFTGMTMPKQEFVFDYNTDNRTTTYDKEHIRYDDSYAIIDTDENLTQSNIENHNYLRTLIERYTGTTSNGKFNGSRTLIENNFQAKLEDDKIEQYYIQVEVVQRVLLNEFIDGASYFAGEIYYDVVTNRTLSGYHVKFTNADGWCPVPSYGNFLTKGSKCTGWHSVDCEDEEKTGCVKCNGYADYCWYYYYKLVNEIKTGEYNSRHVYRFYGHYAIGWSQIYTSRSLTYNEKFMKRAVNSCESSEGKHQVMDPNDETKPFINPKTGQYDYEYYIGPDKDRALVGPSSSYKFQLIGDSCNKGKSPEGIRHFYLESMIDCVDGCKTVCDPNRADYETCIRSDEFLKCAENYCEHLIDYDMQGNARKRKKNCLVNNCKYRYGRDPNTLSKDHNNANLQSEDGCTNSVIDGIASRYGKTELKVFDSKCNVALDNTGHYVPTQDIKGKYVTPCEGDYITDFNGNDADDKTFDQRTYINSICKLVVDSEFTDTTKIKLAAGLGFTYPIVHGGYEYCTYFINKEQWKFDYATIPARNTKYQRDRMLLILKNFNDEVSKVNPDNSNMTAGTQALKAEGNLDGEGKTNFEGNGFDFSKSTIKTTTKEYKLEELNPETKTTELEVEKNSTGSSMKATVALQTDDVDQVTMVADRNISTISINQYTSQSGGRLTYTLKKVCLRTDGTAEVYEAPGNNECYKTGVGANQETIHGSSTHYTSFEIKPNVENPIKASVEVKAKDGPTYYNVDETCTYKVAQSDYMCRIKFDSNGTKLGNKQYESSSVTATIVYDIPSSQIAKVEIDDTGNIQEVIDNKITIVNHNSRSVETHNVTGIITLNNGETVTCPDNVDLYSGPVCGASCRIERAPEDTSGKLYNMTVYNADLYYTYTTYHDIPTLTEFNSRKMDSEPYSYMKKITKSVTNTTNKLEIRLDKPLEKGELILGYVTNSSNKKCNAYCYKSYDEPNTTLDCYAKEKNLDQVKIKEYCKTNWANDINGFKDEEDCFKKCRVPCPQKTSDYNTINNYCDGYASYGFSDKESCINKCYKPIEDDPQDEPYIFRSINVANPFPNSEETEEPYEKGKRIVGTNWRGLSHYITNDENDKTSVTGPNSNEMVEYIIDMTAEDIRQIREDTEKTGEGYKNKRRVYARLDRITTGSTNKVQEYKSSFIRESKFSALFKNSHGIGSRTIHATYPDFK